MEADEEGKVLTGRLGLFARFPFLAQRQENLSHLIKNRNEFLDMFQTFLECFPEEQHLVDIFEYIRISADDILLMNEDLTDKSYQDSNLDSISLGILEARSFLFKYEGDDDKENERKKKNSKLQRSQSERIKDRSQLEAVKFAKQQAAISPKGHKPRSPASPKVIKLDGGSKVKNKFLQNVIGKSKDDENVPMTMTKRSNKQPKHIDPNQPPKKAALVNAKYVTYGRITRDLAVLFWTSATSLIRRFYLIKMVECYVETLGITLGQLGIDTDSFGLKYQQVLQDFQQHILYGFMVSVLMAMANTSKEELEIFKKNGGVTQDDTPSLDTSSKFLCLTHDRVSSFVIRFINI